MLKRESNVRMSNYENNCRFCLEKFGLVNVSLFSEDDAVEDGFISGDRYGRETTTEMIKYCTGIYISPKDNLPQYMCTQCLEKLLQCNRFRRQCLRSAEILKEALSKNLNELDEASDLYDVIADSVGTRDIEIDEELLLGSCDTIDEMMTKTASPYPVDQLLVRERQEFGLSHNSRVFDATVDSENREKSQITEKGVVFRDEELNHIWKKQYKSFLVDIDYRNEHDMICGDSLGNTVSKNSHGSEVIDVETETIRLDERCKKPLALFTKRRNGRRKGRRKRFHRTKRKTLAEKCQICGEMRIQLKNHMLTIHRDLITTRYNNSKLKVLESENNRQNQHEQSISVGLGSTNPDKQLKELEKPLEIPVKRRKRKNMRFRTGRQRQPKLAEKCQICGKMLICLKKHMLTIHRDLITTGYGHSNLKVLESENNIENQHELSISVGLGSTNFDSSHSKVLQGQAQEIKVGIKQKSEHVKLSETEKTKLIHVDCDNFVSEVIKDHGIDVKKVSREEETKDDTKIETLETSANQRKSQRYKHSERIELKSLHSCLSREQYKCDLCNMKFLLKKDLILHLNRNEPYFWKKCNDCDEEFYKNCVFMEHLQNSHLYKCDVCNKGFRYKQSCTQHKQMHV